MTLPDTKVVSTTDGEASNQNWDFVRKYATSSLKNRPEALFFYESEEKYIETNLSLVFACLRALIIRKAEQFSVLKSIYEKTFFETTTLEELKEVIDDIIKRALQGLLPQNKKTDEPKNTTYLIRIKKADGTEIDELHPVV